MSTVSNTPVIQTVYARRPFLGGFGARRVAIWALGIVAVAIAGTYVSRSMGWFDRFLSDGRPAGQFHEVQSGTLLITLNEDGELKPKNSIEVKSEIEGQATILWLVPESAHVAKGDRLVELASDELEQRALGEEIELRQVRSALDSATQELNITLSENASKIEKARIDLDVAELELERYCEGEYEKSKTAILIEIKQNDIDIELKEDELSKNRLLADRGFVTKMKVKELEAALEKAKMTRGKNLLEADILEKYERPKNELQKGAAVDQSRQELQREAGRAESREAQQRAKVEEQKSLLSMKERRYNKLLAQIEKAKIFAPTDGVVQYAGDAGRMRWGGNRIAPGEKVYEGQVIVTLPDVTQMIVSTRVHEADRHQVKEGLTCFVKVPAVPGKRFKGTISKIATFADSADRWLNPQLKEHSAEILLDETDAPVSPGDSAEVELQIDEIANVLTVPVHSVYARGDKRFVFAIRGGVTTPVEVKTGRSNTTLVEVSEGLNAGDRVLMGAGTDLLARLPDVPVTREAPPIPPPVAGGQPAGGQRMKASSGAPAGGPGVKVGK